MKIKTKRYYIYYLARIGGFLVALFPVRVGLYFAQALGRIGYVVYRKYSSQTVANLTNCFPEKSPAEIEKIAKEIFLNMCRNAVEWMNIHKLNKKNVDRWINVEGLEKVESAFRKGKGIIILASHFGNWELTGIFFRLKGYPGNTIGRRIYFKKYDNFINSVRRAKDVRVIYRDESPKKMLKVLKENKILGIVADQDIDSIQGVFVNFFGKPAYTPAAPVAFALASGAPIIPCFMIRQGHKHRFVIDDHVELVQKENKEETILANTQTWSDVLERYIKKYPEQWVWMHRRWKTKKDDHGDLA